MPLYSILDDNGFITHCENHAECPINATPLLNTEFIKPRLVNGVLVEGLDFEELQTIQKKKALHNETQRYIQRTQDGINAYAEISAEFRLAKLSGILTEEQHGIIENILIPVRNEVLAGQWISAKLKLEGIGNVIGDDLYNRLHTQISTYITNNY
jgi:hypothetical protein